MGRSYRDAPEIDGMVVIDDEKRTIHSWLTVLRKTGSRLIQTYKSLSTSEASRSQIRYRDKESLTPTVIRLYDENDKRAGQRKWEDLTAGKTIEGRLEVVNATTQLVDPLPKSLLNKHKLDSVV